MLINLISIILKASKQSKRAVLTLLFEMTLLRLTGARIGFSEYFQFRLYETDIQFDEKKRFVGYAMQAILEEILVDDYARFLSLDKVTMYTLLEGYRIPIPEVRAVYKSNRPNELVQINSRSALTEYLKLPESTPVYLKPSYGGFGRGNTLILDSDGQRLTLGDGKTIAIDKFCDSLDDRGGLGWILQEPLTPHSSIKSICGAKISGIRLHTFLSKEGAVVTNAIWKINAGKGDVDNFQHGASGNMLATIDLDSGIVLRVVAGTGLEQRVNPFHPATGAKLVGFCMPYWQEIKFLVCNAHLAFPSFICPGWDIAVCEDGPKLLEVNVFGDLDLSQHSLRLGFLSERFMALMADRDLADLVSFSTENRKISPLNHRIGQRKHHWKW